MILLLLGVVCIIGLLFGLVAVATSPPDLDKAVRQRLAAIHSEAARRPGGALDASNLLKHEDAGRSGWLDAALHRLALARRAQLYLAQGGSDRSVASLLLVSLGLALAGAFLTALFAPLPLLELAAALAAACLPWLHMLWRRSRRIAAFAAALPDAIDMMARALRAGHSIAAAIEIVAQDAVEPVASEFREVFKQQNFGLPLRDALTQMLDRVPSQDLRVMATAIFVQRETGGNLVEILDRTAFIVRDRQRIQGEIRTHTAQGRLTGWVLSLLPIVMLILINLVNPGYSQILLVDPVGRKLIYAGVALIVLGTIVIHRIINGIEV